MLKYFSLANSEESRLKAYRSLFSNIISDELLEQIRESTNKAWVLGDSRFSERVEALTERRSKPLAKGRVKQK